MARGRLGVEASGGGTTVNVHMTNHFAEGVNENARAVIRQEMPRILSAAKAEVMNAVQRGGRFTKAFK